jgi:serine protease Do
VYHSTGLALFFCLLTAGQSFAQQGFPDLQKQVVSVFEQHYRAVVRIKAQKRQEVDPVVGNPRLRMTIGSGFFVSDEGHILTNSSLVMGMDKVLVEYQKDLEFPAEMVGLDVYSNIALLKVETFPKTATFVQCLPKDAGLPQVGVMAMAISCPLQFSPSPSGPGLITGHEGVIGSRPFPTPILRTSINSNPGDSGSPLFTLDGQFLGINVASIKEIQATCVFPARATNRVYLDLRDDGKVQYGTIGLRVTQSSHPMHGTRLSVKEPIPGKTAAAAGILKDDLILSSQWGPIETLGDLQRAIFFTPIGQSLVLKVNRGGKNVDVPVPVEKLVTSAGSPDAPSPGS